MKTSENILSSLSAVCMVTTTVWAAPLEVGEFAASGNSVRRWPMAVTGTYELAPLASTSLSMQVPPLSDKEREAGGDWRGVLSVDLHGTTGGAMARVTLEAVDPASGELLGSGVTTVERIAPRSPWVVICSSEHPGAEAAKAFDGDPNTDWHTNYSGGKAAPPHWIGMEFGSPTVMSGVHYTPRQGGFTNGVARKYRVEIRPRGEAWRTAASGETDRKVSADRNILEVEFPEAVEVDAFRFVIESDWSGGGFGTAGEIHLPGVKLDPVPPVAASYSRAWAEIPPAMMKLLEGKSFGLRVRNESDSAVVIGTPQFARVHTAPSGKLYGRSNGGLGPDKLGAGLLGFAALTEHKQTVLSVMEVHPRTAAARQKIQPGDVILAVRGRPLPVNDLAPGWTWFKESHEAVIGRETEAALQAGETSLPLTVLRKGRTEIIQLPLDRKAAFTTMDPADDPEAARLLADTLAFLIRTQRDDGSWSGCMIRTTFSGLALLATGDTRHRARVRKAVQWAQERYKKPEQYGNLGFWSGAFAGILYSEWHLATGDRSVLSNLEALRDWSVAGQHRSVWEVPALGHGPSGLPYGNKALVAPACHLLVFEALATRGGMKSGIWELLMPYMEMSWSDPADGGNGTLGYNRSMKDLDEFWSRTGLFAMAAHLRGERSDMRDSMIKVMHERHPWLRNSHAYGEPGGALGLLALNLVSPAVHAEVIRDYAWWFSLAWEPGYGLRFTQPHMGAPYMGEDDLINAAYALVLQGPRRSLHITGLPAGGNTAK
jgi:hypothetical protein